MRHHSTTLMRKLCLKKKGEGGSFHSFRQPQRHLKNTTFAYRSDTKQLCLRIILVTLLRADALPSDLLETKEIVVVT